MVRRSGAPPGFFHLRQITRASERDTSQGLVEGNVGNVGVGRQGQDEMKVIRSVTIVGADARHIENSLTWRFYRRQRLWVRKPPRDGYEQIADARCLARPDKLRRPVKSRKGRARAIYFRNG